MKKISICSAIFAVLLFVISCDDGSKNDDKKEIPDSGETVTDTDTADDSEPADNSDSDSNSDSDISDTGIPGSDDDSDSTPAQPDDDADSAPVQPDDDDTTDDSDSEEIKTPCNPNPCVDIATSDGECTEKEDTFECGCLENYTWKDGNCVANTRYETCTLPAHAVRNTAEGITQQWNGSTWEPPVESVYNEEASTTECRFKCIFNQDEQYEYDGEKCVISIPPCNAENADKTCKDYDTGYIWSAKSEADYTFKNQAAKSYCESLTTNGLSWRLPNIDELRTTIRNCDKTKTGGTCQVSVENWDKNTYWSEETCGGCELNETEGNSIFGDKSKAFWSSTVSETAVSAWIVAFWNTGYARIEAQNMKSEMRIRCIGNNKCKENFVLDGNFECVPAQRQATCTNLPENAVNNPAGHHIYQIWNEESGKWLPESTEYKYCADYNSKECCFQCQSNSEWNAATKKCEPKTRTARCTGRPYYGEWNSVNEITQTQDITGIWLPSSTGVYNETPSTTECRFKCEDGYVWNNIDSLCEKIECGNYVENNGVCKDTANGLMWTPYAAYRTSVHRTYQEAVNFCSQLVLGGYSDWRLPSIDELRTTIKNCPNTVPGGVCEITDTNPDRSSWKSDQCQCEYSMKYSKFEDPSISLWSSTKVTGIDTDRHWSVIYSTAYIYTNPDSGNMFVRCVR